MKEIQINIKLSLLLTFLILISSCSTKKKTYVSRKYHDITAKYNGYFNGKESLKYGIKKLEKAHSDDYSLVLDVFKHSQIITSKTHHSYMDKSIKKGSVVIQKHSINIRNKEYCKWIDDSYFLVAKAYYFKGEYIEAKKTFDYIKNKFKKTEIAFESELWSAKCYIALNDFYSAENILDELQSKKRFPEKLDKDLHLALADLYIKQEMYSDAVDELRSATNIIKRKNIKARYFYIIAQIYQEASNVKQSKKYFELVLKSNPEYEMVFNAKMNLATTLRNKKDVIQMRSNLLKMIKDEKNKDYLDQIYYTLAEMNIIESDTVNAIENYNLSTTYSIDNDNQKSISFLSLGKIYYHKSDYTKAKIFYDSAFVFMPEENSFYPETKNTQQILENLLIHLNTISYEDSLQWLVSLSDSDRKLVIQSVIAEVIKKEQEELRDQQGKNTRGMMNQNGRNESFGRETSGGKWYFYNPATLSFGMSEFRKKWGKRKLEDDWRRSNKKTLTNLDSDTTSNTDADKSTTENLKSAKYYLDQLPLSEEDIMESNNKIINAYYGASVIYKEDLVEFKKSEEMLEGLVKRFPNHEELTPLSYYLIYNLQLENKSVKKAVKTKNKLISRFPESNYAKTLLDTNFITSILEKEAFLEKEYNDIYDIYNKDSFNLSHSLSSLKIKELEKTKDSKYLPKYFLIQILSDFKLTNDTILFINNLKIGEINYSETKSKDRFTEILNLLENTKDISERNKTSVLKTPYRYKDNSDHFLVLLLPKENTDITFIKTLVSNFNLTDYSTDILEINTMLLGLDQHLLIVKTFNSTKKVERYAGMLLSNPSLLKELNKSDFNKIIISKDNFVEFYKNKDIEGYSKFFNNNYLEN